MQKTRMQCLGFIMDGNRRWARAKGLPVYEGHRKGGEVFTESIEWVYEAGIPHVVYYAFSTENWSRSKEEISFFMDLLRENLRKIEERVAENQATGSDDKKIHIRIIGRREDFDNDIQNQFSRLEKMNDECADPVSTIWVALSYGGRAEIVSAVNQAVLLGKKVTEKSFEQLLWTASMPDPDIIVRTGGEKRLSNFVTWKSVYSELYFIKKPWPALTKLDFEDILKEYESRERRKGT